MNSGGVSDPYYDLIEDYDLIVSSFQSQYGIRLSKEVHEMPWEEFRQMLIGISPDTALGRVVAIRAEDRKEVLENFTPEQHRVRNAWQSRHAEFIKAHTSKAQVDAQMQAMKMAFMRMAGLGGD